MADKYWFPDADSQKKAMAEIQSMRASGKPVNSAEIASKYGGKPLQDAVLGQLSPAAQAITQQLLDYQMALPSGRAMMDPDMKSAMIAVRQIDPTWNAADYNKRVAALKEFTTGKGGDVLARTNMVLGHLNQLHEAIPKLGNRDNQYWNHVANWWIDKMDSDPRITAYEIPQEFVSNELPAVLRGGTTAEQDIQRTLGLFGRDKGQAQQQQGVASAAELLKSRILEQRQRMMNALQGSNRGVQILSPFARKALKNIAPDVDVDALDPPNATAIKAWKLAGVPEEVPTSTPASDLSKIPTSELMKRLGGVQ